MKKIYTIGSLRNPQIPVFGQELRSLGFEVFDEWYAASEDADEWWKTYSIQRGHSYQQALAGLAAKHVFEFDYNLIQQADIGILLLPAGRSGHVELGYMAGTGKQTYVLLPEDEEPRWDVMYKFFTGVFGAKVDLFHALRNLK